MVFEAIMFLAVLVISSKMLGELMHRINQPTIIGNVLAGIIVGPAMFAIVQPIEAIDLFVSIGVFFLFFIIGLEEIDLPGLFRVLRGRLFAGSAVAFLIPFIVAGLFGISLDMEFAKAFAIASVIGASSLGVTAKILTDMGKLRSTIGLEIFTVTAIVEFIAIILTSVLIQVNQSDSPQIMDFVWLFSNMVIFFVVAGLLSVFVIPKFFKLLREHLRAKQVYFGVVVGMILLVAYFAEISGVHGAIGALLLGIAVSRMNREEYQEISKNVSVLGYGIFIPIFFAGIGLHFTPNFFDIEWWIIAVFLGIIIGVKFGSSYLAVRIAKMQPASTVAYGVMSKGAVDLALMLSLLKFDMLDDNLFSLLVFGTLITMIISSVELQRNLKKVVQVKVGASELSLTPVYFRRAVSDLTAENVLTNYEKIYSDITIEDAEKQLEKSPIQGVLVFDRKEKLVGITSKDYLKAHKRKRNAIKLSEVMYKKFPTVIPHDFIFSVIQKMNAYPFDIIPVISADHENEVVGVVTNESIFESLIENNSK